MGEGVNGYRNNQLEGRKTRRFIYLFLALAVLIETSMAFGQKSVNCGDNSGLKGKTIFRVFSGAEGGKTTERPRSMEFAIAPVEGDSPIYGKAIFIKSDDQGNYEVSLPPGTYWLGPKPKALDPKKFEKYGRGSVRFSEKVVVVKQGTFTHVDVLQESFAP